MSRIGYEGIGHAEVYLTFLVTQPSNEIKKEYLKRIKIIDKSEFQGTGWSLYEKTLKEVYANSRTEERYFTLKEFVRQKSESFGS